MKKILSILLSISLAFSLTACGTPHGIAESNEESLRTEEYSEASSEEEPDSEAVSESVDEDIMFDDESEVELSDEHTIPDNASEYAVEFYNRYVELSKDNGFKVSDVTHSGNYTEFSLIFGKYENKFSFYKDEKSFTVYIDNASSGSEKKNIIAKIFMGLSELSSDEAKNLSQDFANSYSNEHFSDTLALEEYLVVLLPDKSKYNNHFKYLKCIHSDELWNTVDKEDYPTIDKKMYEAPELNTGEKCKVSGTITEWHFETFYSDVYKGVATIKCENGDEYCLQYLYENKPVSFEVGVKYTIYGSIANGYVSIDYPERID